MTRRFPLPHPPSAPASGFTESVQPVRVPLAQLRFAAERHGPGGPAGLQNRPGRATHGLLGSTPGPLRQANRSQDAGCGGSPSSASTGSEGTSAALGSSAPAGPRAATPCSAASHDDKLPIVIDLGAVRHRNRLSARTLVIRRHRMDKECGGQHHHREHQRRKHSHPPMQRPGPLVGYEQAPVRSTSSANAQTPTATPTSSSPRASTKQSARAQPTSSCFRTTSSPRSRRSPMIEVATSSSRSSGPATVVEAIHEDSGIAGGARIPQSSKRLDAFDAVGASHPLSNCHQRSLDRGTSFGPSRSSHGSYAPMR
jgi:hypothetical protein